ncbi:DUF4352 domain-containing protein [Streptomyces sp. H34-S4]|uniref:DUF4352 domain-containing protein n=1 Tax=Streptomyces sp. H34-S4 TaxID=2996463 RepID=UPI0022716702|nr:DUF4352 domain-containing protein [Streptomyces sp. H34-S4]MCY0937316.1 DUF4352 domain-containing protein [Streptomyces sp. H34-S4]
MSTPPNPPSTPSGSPTEPAGTPAPEADSIPAPAQPLSLDKPPALTPSKPPAPTPPLPEGPAQPADAAAAADQGEPADAAAAGAGAGVPAAGQAAAPAQPFAQVPAPGSFAPVTPAPGAPYGAPAAPVWGAPHPAAPGAPAPANPSAAPAGGYPGGPQAPGFPAPPAASNGLAVAALLLGLLGILVGLVPFFFWAGALLALTGVAIGIAAVVKARRGAPRATMAAIGTVLSVLGLGASVGGWFITTTVIEKIDARVADNRSYDDDYDDDGYYDDEPTSPATPTEPAPTPSPSDIPGMNSALAWGKPYTYEDGVQVTVQSAAPYTPSSTAYPPEARKGNAVKVKVKIVNNSGAALDVDLAVPHARDDQGTEAEMAFDGSVPKMFKGSVLAGESMTGTFAFIVPEGTKSLHFEIAPGTTYDDAIWSGPIG